MDKISILTQGVFGISNKYIDSYLERTEVDEIFKDGLVSDKHIIIYGSSKQGKSSLIREHVRDNEKIIVDCTPKMQLIDIYKSLLRQLNVQIEDSISIETGKEFGGKLSTKAKLKIPFISEVEVNAEVAGKKTRDTRIEYKTVEYNLSIAQDISEVIKQCNYKGRVVIENFHYLAMNIQMDLAFDLRTFEDNNILFIILGIWRERNRLTLFNGDLIDRLIEVPVEPWSDKDFLNVLKEGEPILNVSFDKISDSIVRAANGSVGVFQELCKYSCLKAGIKETNFSDTIYLEDVHLDQAIEVKVDAYSGRHIRCLEEFISGDDTKLDLPYFFVKAILDFDVSCFEKGLKKAEIENKIIAFQEENKNIRKTDFNRFFNHIVEYQINKHISPPLFDFDKGSQAIKIIDSTFIFFIRNKNRLELMECFCKPE
jgi:hypothetical protein